MTPDTSDPSLIRNSWDDPEFAEERVRDAIARLEARDTETPRIDLLRAVRDDRQRIWEEVVALRATVARVEAVAEEAENAADRRDPTHAPHERDINTARAMGRVNGIDGTVSLVRAALAGGVAADAPSSSDGGAK